MNHKDQQGKQVAPMETDPEILVSVIMIFLNARKYISEAIESVMAQTMNEWELVLVDDGSTDGSREVALSYAQRLPERMHVHSHPGRVNLGTGASRNLGMQVTRGQYLAFLDADDVYEPERLRRCVGVLAAHPDVGVVVNRELYWRRWQREKPRSLLPDRIVGLSADLDHEIPPPKLFVSMLATQGAAVPGICSLTFRKSVIDVIGGVPDGFDTQYEDQALLAKLLLNFRAIVIGDCLARYRQHPQSLTHAAQHTGDYRPGQPCAARGQFISWLQAYVRNQGIHEPILDRTLANELREAYSYSPRSRVAGLSKSIARFLLGVAGAVLPRRLTDVLLARYWAMKDSRLERRAAACATIVAVRAIPSTLPHSATSPSDSSP